MRGTNRWQSLRERSGLSQPWAACTVHRALKVDAVIQLEEMPELVRAGVDTFKIEGRLKGPEYVFTATRAYREAVDVAWSALLAAR